MSKEDDLDELGRQIDQVNIIQDEEEKTKDAVAPLEWEEDSDKMGESAVGQNRKPLPVPPSSISSSNQQRTRGSVDSALTPPAQSPGYRRASDSASSHCMFRRIDI